MRIFGDLRKPTTLALAVAACGTLALAPQVHAQRQAEAEAVAEQVNLLALHRNLCEIESTSGDEYQVGQWLKKFFEQHDWTVELQTIAGNRSNVLAYPPTVKKGKAQVLLSSHIDTVPPYIPYSLKNDGKEIWGRGTVDAKGSVAAQIKAAMDLVADESASLPDDALALLFVVGEENTGEGMKYFSAHKHHNYGTIIFGEPTEGKLACGHKGALGVQLNITGKAAHSGYPQYGLDANAILIDAMHQLIKLAPDLPSSDKFGKTTLNPGIIEGGVAVNVVSPTGVAGIAIRLADSTPKKVAKTIEKTLQATVDDTVDQGGKFEITYPIEGYPPIDISCDVEGFETDTFNYGTDIPNLDGTYRKYLYGPGSILVSHADNEHLTVADLRQAVKDYKKIILHALENP